METILPKSICDAECVNEGYKIPELKDMVDDSLKQAVEEVISMLQKS